MRKNKKFIDYVKRYSGLREVSKELGIGVTSISFYVRGLNVPSPKTMARIAIKTKNEVPILSWFEAPGA